MEINSTNGREEISAGVYPELCREAAMTKVEVENGNPLRKTRKNTRDILAAFLTALSLIVAPVSMEGCGLTKRQRLQVDQKIADAFHEILDDHNDLEARHLMLEDRVARNEDVTSDIQKNNTKQDRKMDALQKEIEDNSKNLRSKLQDLEHTLRTLVEEKASLLLDDQKAKYQEIIPRLKNVEDGLKNLDDKFETLNLTNIENMRIKLEQLLSDVKTINTNNNENLNKLALLIKNMLTTLEVFVEQLTASTI